MHTYKKKIKAASDRLSQHLPLCCNARGLST